MHLWSPYTLLQLEVLWLKFLIQTPIFIHLPYCNLLWKHYGNSGDVCYLHCCLTNSILNRASRCKILFLLATAPSRLDPSIFYTIFGAEDLFVNISTKERSTMPHLKEICFLLNRRWFVKLGYLNDYFTNIFLRLMLVLPACAASGGPKGALKYAS